MYCVSCGKQLNDADKFCAKCGTSVSQEKSIENKIDIKPTDKLQADPDTEIKQPVVKKPFKFYWIIYLGLSLMIIGSLAALIIPILAKSRIDYSAVVVSALWIGIVAAVMGKQKSQSVGLWFCAGFFGVGMILLALVSILGAIIK
jgi:uncharacterized membrane protein YvbJ